MIYFANLDDISSIGLKWDGVRNKLLKYIEYDAMRRKKEALYDNERLIIRNLRRRAGFLKK